MGYCKGGKGIMVRFFTDKENILEDKINIIGDDVNHVRNVLRLRVGDNVVICDGDCNDYISEITSIEKSVVTAKILSAKKNDTESNIDITLFQCVLKSDRMDYVIQKATEVGVKRIVPVISERTIVKIKSEKDKENKIKRWTSIAEGASKQSGRGIVPEIAPIISFKEICNEFDNIDKVIIPYEENMDIGLKSVLKDNASSIGVIIGAEGGFCEDEVRFVSEKGAISVTLGKRILRAETAGVVTAAIIGYELGDMG